MKIATDENNIITAFAAVGELKGGFDFSGDIPEDFQVGKYMLGTEGDIVENPDFVLPVIPPEPPTNEVLADAVSNSYTAFFDGIKNTFSRDNPLALNLPQFIMPNAFYRWTDGKLYVGMKKGMVTKENFREMLESDELPEED